jgi:hypothetical protein
MSAQWNALASRRRFLRFVAGSPLLALAGSAEDMFGKRSTVGALATAPGPRAGSLTQEPT